MECGVKQVGGWGLFPWDFSVIACFDLLATSEFPAALDFFVH